MSKQNYETDDLKVGDIVCVYTVFIDEYMFGVVTKLAIDGFLWSEVDSQEIYYTEYEGIWSRLPREGEEDYDYEYQCVSVLDKEDLAGT